MWEISSDMGSGSRTQELGVENNGGVEKNRPTGSTRARRSAGSHSLTLQNVLRPGETSCYIPPWLAGFHGDAPLG